MKKPHISRTLRLRPGGSWLAVCMVPLYDAYWYEYWYECANAEATGWGSTPKEAYDQWYKAILRPYQRPAF